MTLLRTRDPSMADLFPGVERHGPTILAPVVVNEEDISLETEQQESHYGTQPADQEAADAAASTGIEPEDEDEIGNPAADETVVRIQRLNFVVTGGSITPSVSGDDFLEDRDEIAHTADDVLLGQIQEQENSLVGADVWSEDEDSSEDEEDEIVYSTSDGGGGGIINRKFQMAKSVVESLPVVVPRKEGVGENDLDCAICTDEFLVEEKARKLPCCHCYHEECILRWLGRRRTCPLCRYKMPRRQLGGGQPGQV